MNENYNRSDLEFDYCVIKFVEMQAAKRDAISQETMKVWFREFIKLGWNKYKFDLQFDALITTEISGHAIRIDNWINAQPELSVNQQAYNMFKPDRTEKTKGGLKGLREYIDELDKTLEKTKTGLPFGWKKEFYDDWRLANRIKKSLRENQKEGN